MKAVLCIGDITASGKAGLSVTLPVLSAMGIVCYPVACTVLSGHTAQGAQPLIYSCQEGFIQHFIGENIQNVNAILTGYLPKSYQRKELLFLLQAKRDALKIVDPVMADGAMLYSGFDKTAVREITQIAKAANIITPNLTEAQLLVGQEPRKAIKYCEILPLITALKKISPSVIITGIETEKGYFIAGVDGENTAFLSETEKYDRLLYGTGDLFTAVFTGKYLTASSFEDAVVGAIDFVQKAIKNTNEHTKGLYFEPLLSKI